MATHTIDGLHVRDSGEEGRPALLCLHSLFLDGGMFDGLTAAAAGRFRVVTPDFRGQGASAAADGDEVTMERCADDVEAVLDALALDAVHVVAQSMGGDVAVRVAARRPSAIRSLVLLGSSARAEPPDQRAQFEPIADAVAEQGFTGEILEMVNAIMYGATTRADPERAAEVERWRDELAALPKALAPAVRGVVRRSSVVDLLPAITAPALVISGTDDIARPPAWADEVVAGLPNAELWRLEGIGHRPILEAPGRVSPRVLEFADAAEAAAPART
jgi:3-oxoadipate enol-lactonase